MPLDEWGCSTGRASRMGSFDWRGLEPPLNPEVAKSVIFFWANYANCHQTSRKGCSGLASGCQPDPRGIQRGVPRRLPRRPQRRRPRRCRRPAAPPRRGFPSHGIAVGRFTWFLFLFLTHTHSHLPNLTDFSLVFDVNSSIRQSHLLCWGFGGGRFML